MAKDSGPVWKDPDIVKVRELLELFRPVAEGADDQTWDERRAGMDAFAGIAVLAEGLVREDVDIDGLHAARLTPKGADTTRTLLYLHGGGYCVGSSVSHAALASRLAGVIGAPTLVPDYRLAPEHPFPAAVDDALKAYRHLLDSGIAPGKIAIAGDSAGGGLTLATALAIRDAGLPQPGCLFAISPWANLAQTGAAYAAIEPIDPMLSRASLDEFAAAYAPGRTDHPHASPALGDYVGIAPLLIHVGGAEVLLSDACAVAERAGIAGVDVRLEIWPEMVHVWHAFADQLQAGWRAINAGGEWMKGKLG